MRNISFGERVRLRRKEMGLTAEELARRVGVDRTYLSKIERHNFLPSPEVFTSIDKILNLGPDYGRRYIQKKYPELYFARGQESFVKYLKDESPATYAALIAPIGAINTDELLQEFSRVIEGEKEVDPHPIAIELLKRFNPSQAKNAPLINKLAAGLKKLRKETKDSLKVLQKEKIDLIKLMASA